MKKCISLLFLCHMLKAAAQVSDGFTDGNFSDNPPWRGDSLAFEVNTLHQLHLNTEGADTAFLATEAPGTGEMEWSLWTKLSFNTSANNYARVYLASDVPGLDGPLNGYYLQIGGASDSMVLFRQEGAEHTPLLTCQGCSTGHPVNVFRWTVTRSAQGCWSLFADTTGANDRIPRGSVTDVRVPCWNWSGIFCRFTSSNAAKFYFDDFYCGTIRKDTIPPAIAQVRVAGEGSLQVRFTETVSRSSAEDPDHYTRVASGTHPLSAVRDPDDLTRVLLTFAGTWTADSCEWLSVGEIADVSGNVMTDTTAPFCSHPVRASDLVIDEIMADPDPPSGLPSVEYVELYNRSGFPLELGGWTFSYGATQRTFPEITLGANSYLLISSDSTLSDIVPAVLMLSSWGSLSNEGMQLILRSESGQVVHAVDYTKDWYRDSFKQEGGWSLEMIDTDNPCACGDNWAPSISAAGGTPGHANSVSGLNPDTAAPVLWRAAMIPRQVIRVDFSERMDSSGMVQPSAWDLDGRAPDSVQGIPPGYSSAFLWFSGDFTEGVLYTLTCTADLPDCAGNRLLSPASVHTGIAEIPGFGDIRINEILPEPAPGGSRFVELYNCSDKAFDLADLALACSKDTMTGILPEGIPVSKEALPLLPGEYQAVCTNVADVWERYGRKEPASFTEVPGLAAFGPEQGQVVLMRKADGMVLDRMIYERSMQHPLLADLAGVSLERVSPNRPSLDRTNWHSASSLSGYGTPGARNSQWFEAPSPGGEFQVEPAIFSPDNDGFEDILLIRFKPDQPGYIATVAIYDWEGRKVKVLAESLLLGDDALLTWDGLSDGNKVLPAGTYVILARIFLPGGQTRTFRKAVVLATRI